MEFSGKLQIRMVKFTHSFVNLTCFLKFYGDTGICFSVKYKHYPVPLSIYTKSEHVSIYIHDLSHVVMLILLYNNDILTRQPSELDLTTMRSGVSDPLC